MKKARTQIFLLLITITFGVNALDIAKLPVRHLKTKAYQMSVIEEALIQSQDKYGAYQFIAKVADLSSKRSFQELNKAEQDFINLRVGITSREREENSIPIRIPLRKGLLSYKLLVVNKKNIKIFQDTKNLNMLKRFTLGIVYDWVTTDILHKNNFKIIDVPSYDGLFRMLSVSRYDYTVLGVNEAFPILASLKKQNLSLTVAPSIALYINTPSYIFVSKNNPRLAERITWGLEKMIKNGRFDELFYQFHQEYLDKVNLKERTIITIPNPNLNDLLVQPPLGRQELWFNPLE